MKGQGESGQGQNLTFKKRVKQKLNFMKVVDFYAKPFELTYKGFEGHKTFLGASLSLIVILVVMTFFFYKLHIMLTFEQSTIRKNTIINISNNYMEPFKWDDRDLMLVFALTDISGIRLTDDPKYGRFVLRQQQIVTRYYENGTSYRERTMVEVPYDKCTNFSNTLNKEFNITDLGLQNYYCSIWTNLTIQGNFLSPEYRTVQLIYQKCQGNNCATDEEFKHWYPQSFVEIRYINSYFEQKNQEKSIQRYIETLFYPLENSNCIYSQVYFKKTNLKLSDNFFGYFQQPVEDYYYTLGDEIINSVDMQTFGKDFLFFQAWRMSKEIDEYERVVYNFQNILQDVGGFQSSIHIIGFLLYFRFRGLSQYSTLVKKIYQMEQIDDEEDETASTKKDIQTVEETLATQTTMERIINPLMKIIKSRKKIGLDCRDYARLSILGFKCMKSKNTLRDKKRHIYRNAEGKIRSELDCVSILHKLQMVDQMSSILLNQAQRVLFYYQKRFTVSQDQPERSEILYKKSFSIKRMQDTHDIQRALSLVCDQENLKVIDKRLIWGLISNKPYINRDISTKKQSLPSPRKRIIKRKNNSERVRMMKGNGEQSSQEQVKDQKYTAMDKIMESDEDRQAEIALKNLEFNKNKSSFVWLWKSSGSNNTNKSVQIQPIDGQKYAISKEREK